MTTGIFQIFFFYQQVSIKTKHFLRDLLTFTHGFCPLSCQWMVEMARSIKSCHKQISGIWGCVETSPNEMRIYLNFNLLLQYSKQMHADVLVLKPQLFPTPRFSQEDPFHCHSSQPSLMLWSPVLNACLLLPTPFCLPVPFSVPWTKIPCNPAAGIEFAMWRFTAWKALSTQGWELEKIYLKDPIYPTILLWEIRKTHPQFL